MKKIDGFRFKDTLISLICGHKVDMDIKFAKICNILCLCFVVKL